MCYALGRAIVSIRMMAGVIVFGTVRDNIPCANRGIDLDESAR